MVFFPKVCFHSKPEIILYGDLICFLFSVKGLTAYVQQLTLKHLNDT